MDNPRLFQELADEQKVDFFIKCQEILVNYHPDSEFICRENDINTKKHFFKEFYHQYKGYTYNNENVCLLFNRVFIKDRYDPVKVIKDHIYQPPQEEYNAISIDFVAFNKLEHCLEFCKNQYDEKIKYILFVKNNEVKIYETKKLLEKAFHFNVTIS